MLTLERAAPPPEREASTETGLLLLSGWQLTGCRADAAVGSACSPEINWAQLLWSAHRQGLLPALYRRLEAERTHAAPADILAQLREHYHTNRRRNLALLEQLRIVAPLLAGAGIPSLPLVVPSVLARFYAEPGDRQCEPLDLLVRPSDAERARRLLLGQGYAPVHDLSPAREAALRRARASILHHPELNIRIHLHDRAAPAFFPIRLGFRSLWQRRQTLDIAGTPILVPAVEDLLILLCVNGALHLWGQLAWVCDVAQLVEHTPELDWPAVLHRARAAGATRMVLLGLHLAHTMLGATLPAAIAAYGAADPEVLALAGGVQARITHDLRGRTGEGERLRFRLRARERRADRLRYCAAFVLSPTVEDWKALSLPDSLFPLYHAVRPVRFAAALGARALSLRQKAPYMSSPMPVVNRMLTMAALGPDDVVYDLGCGDGRIVIEAARRFGVRGVGIDLDPARIAESRVNARAAGVEHLVRFEVGDAMKADLSEATVVTLWMLQTLNLQLRPRLQAALRPGARIVGHSFDMGDWAPERTEIITHDGDVALAYLWRVTPDQPPRRR